MKTLIKSFVMIASIIFIISSVSFVNAETIGILVFDGFLTSDVTAPIEVFGAAVKKPLFSKYKLTVIQQQKRRLSSRKKDYASSQIKLFTMIPKWTY